MKGEGEAHSGKEEKYKRGQHDWGPGEAWVAYGDGLHGGKTGGKNGGKGIIQFDCFHFGIVLF